MITLNDNKIQKMAEEGHKKAQKILKLTKNSSRFLSTIQIGVTLSGFLTSASASQSFAKKLADVMTFLPFSPSVVEGVATVIITIILSYFSLVLGDDGKVRALVAALGGGFWTWWFWLGVAGLGLIVPMLLQTAYGARLKLPGI